MHLEFHWAILPAALAGFVIGAVWYSIFGERRITSVGKTGAELKPAAMTWAVAVVANLLIAFVFCNVMRMFEISGSIFGLIFGFLIWLGFAMPVVALNNVYTGRSTNLTVIDGGQALLNICLQGVILASLGVAASGY